MNNMNVWMYVSLALLVVVTVMLVRLLIIKKNIKDVKNELFMTRDESYNRQLQVTLIDKDVTNLAAEMNSNLDYQKNLKIEAEKAENRLKQSVADIAHDLRTPLTVIKGNLQLLENEQLDEKSKECVRICQDKAETLKNMIDDFFEMSVLESDRTKVVLSKVNVSNILAQFVIDHEAIIRDKGLTPDIVFPEKTITAMADMKLLNRMLTNLLGNVLKYAKDTFSIKLEEIIDKEVCRIIFANKLLKDSDVDTDKLFDRTYRADKSRSSSGAGLGLYIVKLLADKQDIEVGAEIEDGNLIIYLDVKMNSRII